MFPGVARQKAEEAKRRVGWFIAREVFLFPGEVSVQGPVKHNAEILVVFKEFRNIILLCVFQCTEKHAEIQKLESD